MRRRGGLDELAATASPAQCRAGLRAARVPRHRRHGRRRALRVRGRHLGAFDRLAARAPRRATRRSAATATCRASASTCWATRTSTAPTPTGRCSMPTAIPMRCCRAPRTRPTRSTWAATAATWCCASWSRMSAGFWRFMDAQVGGDPALRKQLAEEMVGRTMEGEPLVGAHRRTHPGRGGPAQQLHLWRRRREACAARSAPTSGAAIRATPTCRRAAGFLFVGQADAGFRCHGPSGRQGLIDPLPPAAAARPRIRPRVVSVEQALSPAPANPGDATGLHFICLGANIARQFEFVQSAWLAGLRFDGLPGDSDPLTGNHLPRDDGTPTDGFAMPLDSGPDRRVCGLPQFVTVRGGAYSFCRACGPCATCRRCSHELECQPSDAAGQHRLGLAQLSSAIRAMALIRLERRFDPLLRPAFDAFLRDPLARFTTALINSAAHRRRPGDRRGAAAARRGELHRLDRQELHAPDERPAGSPAASSAAATPRPRASCAASSRCTTASRST